MRTASRSLGAFCLLLGILPAQQPATGAKRALVIANAGYTELPAVPASRLNAEAIKAQLTTLGFDVVNKLDLDQASMVREIGSFLGTINANDTVFIYYSGYGMQSDDANFLLPKDFDPKGSGPMAGRVYLVRRILTELETRKAGQRIVVLDAAWECPNLPDNNTQGLAAIPQLRDRTLVSFNTAANAAVRAPTGSKPSRYTDALVKALNTAGLTLGEVFNKVQKDGIQSGEGQTPYLAQSAIDTLYFIPKKPVEPTVVMTEKPVQPGEGRGNQKDQLIYVWIPKGEFQMGCVKDDTECQEDEKPQHPVTISKGFWISNSEVTLSAYQLFLDANPGHPQPPKTQTNRGDLTTDAPRTNVSWQDAQDYCKWAGGSLPSEAQWEYAARGGVAGQIYPWGNTSDPKQPQANYFGAVKSRALKNFYETTPVHRYPKNSWNLFDMAGNVREWVADSYNTEAYKAAGPFVDPLDGSAGKEHVVRGGSWNSRAQLLRNSARGHVKVDHDNQTGFRCVVPVL